MDGEVTPPKSLMDDSHNLSTGFPRVTSAAHEGETIKVERLAPARLFTAPVVFMLLFGLVGWTALVLTTVSEGVGPGAPPLAFAAFLLVVVAVRVMAFRMLPASPLGL